MTYHFAYITFDWNYEHSYNLLQGMQKYVHENKNIKFTVFNALAKYIDQQVDVYAANSSQTRQKHSTFQLFPSIIHYLMPMKLAQIMHPQFIH